MNTRTLPRPTRRARLDAHTPISYLPTCAGHGLAWPSGADVPTLADVLPRRFKPTSIDDRNDFKQAVVDYADAESLRALEITGAQEGNARDVEICALIETRWNRVLALADKHTAQQVQDALKQDWKPGPELPPLRFSDAA